MCASPHSSTAVLKQALKTAWSDMGEDTVRRSCLSVMRRMEAVVKAKGGHIEVWCYGVVKGISVRVCAKF